MLFEANRTKMALKLLFNTIIPLLVCFTHGLSGQDCGENVNATAVNRRLTSPGYPRNYENNMDCTYLITAPLGQSVYLTTSDIDGVRVERSPFCEKDYIAVIDGPNPNGPVVTTTCYYPVSVLSTGRYLTLLFHSDGDTTARGFNMLYRSVNITESCPVQRLNALKANYAITSPLYPNNYPNNIECEWRIAAPDGYVVYIEVKESSLEPSEGCEKDYVEVYDAVYKGGGFTVGKWCGAVIPSPIHVSGIFMAIVFHSDREISDTGFRIQYSARPKSDFPDRPETENNRGLVVGVVVAVILLIVILVVVGAVCVIRKRKTRRSNNSY